MVAEMLDSQSELKHEIEDYVEAHHEHTFDMSDVQCVLMRACVLLNRENRQIGMHLKEPKQAN